MSTEEHVFHLWGMTLTLTTMMYSAAFFGGFVPCLGDLIVRQNLPAGNRANIDLAFFIVKVLLIPAGSFFITSLCIASDKVTTWEAALYVAISFPYLVLKWITAAQSGKSQLVTTEPDQ
ncbi:hypothetical protein [Rahnella aquatilis]|uniref:hypothetical protein n=1 Tax=Rahnella aquatilis TaxID=34038 RepID=UPI0012E22456